MTDIRWQQRFQNLSKAVALLNEPFDSDQNSLSKLEKEGIIQRFEFVLELSWKTMKDFLESEGETLVSATPKSVIKKAFSVGIIENGDLWIAMLNHRNLLSHSYDETIFEDAYNAIRDEYLNAINDLNHWFNKQLND